MPRTIRLQGDSNAHDRPWAVAVEQGFCRRRADRRVHRKTIPRASRGGCRISRSAGRRASFSRARSRSIRCANGARSSASMSSAGQDNRSRHHGAQLGIMVRNDSKVQSLDDLRNVPIAVTWHAGTFYAAIEVMEAAGVRFDEIKLEHANDRLDALISGQNEAAALMEPLVSRAREAGCRTIASLRWRGGIVAGDDVDDETAAKAR